MKKLCLLALAMLPLAAAQPAPEHWLLTFQLDPGIDLDHLTPAQTTAFLGHRKHLGTLLAKGLVTGGRTSEPVDSLGLLIMACDEATAKAAAADDPATRAGYVKSTVRPFSLLIPPVPPAVLVSDTRSNYEAVARDLLEAARKMPEENYAYRPTPEVRTFAQLVGHVAEAQYAACSPARGAEYTTRHIEQTLTAKSELLPALEAAIGYCRESWSQLTPSALADPVTIFGQKRTKLGAMDLATAHAFEHYGNMVTYLRLKGLVPPTAQ